MHSNDVKWPTAGGLVPELWLTCFLMHWRQSESEKKKRRKTNPLEVLLLLNCTSLME